MDRPPSAAALDRPQITPNARQFQNNGRPTPPAQTRGVQQPKPQDLRQRTGPSNIIVSTRQKGNPILKEIKNQAWEFGDIDPDYVLGTTTCALFLSLKYHRLHPEYIYGRIRALQGRWSLRVLLVMVDITAHEESLKELSKTSLINNVTIMLCWSAQEAGRYLELYKIYENAPANMIKAPPSKSHGDRLTEFITIPRSVNKTDALGLVSNFGSVRTAVNAKPEEILMIAGWGGTKVKQWHSAVSEPFRHRKATRRGIDGDNTLHSMPFKDALSRGITTEDDGDDFEMSIPPTVLPRPPKRTAEELSVNDIHEGEEEALLFAAGVSAKDSNLPTGPAAGSSLSTNKTTAPDPEVSDGVLAALARLREQG
jgi:DNA excision repair protein ERCC-1